MSEKGKNIIRWIAIPFAVIVGFGGANLFAHYLLWEFISGNVTSNDGKTVLFFFPRDATQEYLHEFFKCIIGPWGGVRLAQYTAPKLKLAVAVITALIFVVFAGMVSAIIIEHWNSPAWNQGPFFNLICCIAIIASVSWAVWETYKEHRQELIDNHLLEVAKHESLKEADE